MKIAKFLKSHDQFGAQVGFHFGTYLHSEEGMS